MQRSMIEQLVTKGTTGAEDIQSREQIKGRKKKDFMGLISKSVTNTGNN